MTPTSEFAAWTTVALAAVLAVAFPASASADTDVASDAESDTASDPLDAGPDVAGTDASDTGLEPDADDVDEMEPADGESGDVAELDAGDDVGDAASEDVAPGDVGTDAADVRDGGEPEDTGGVEDVGPMPDVTDGPDADDAGETTRARFFGRVDLQSRRGASGVRITLTRTDDGETREQTTGDDGRFAFEDLPLGSYEVELAIEGFATIAESFELVGDREEHYTLYSDQEVDVRIRALFTHVDEPPETVDFTLDGERGQFAPDESIEVENEVAEWTVEEVGVGNWTVTAMAEDFEDLSYRFRASGPDGGASEGIDVRLFMTPAGGRPPPPDTSGCSCGDSDGAQGGGVPGPTTPTPTTRPLLLLLLSLGSSRWLLSHFASSRE